jgi:hypothetical protein
MDVISFALPRAEKRRFKVAGDEVRPGREVITKEWSGEGLELELRALNGLKGLCWL